MPSRLEKLSPTFFEQIEDLSFQEIAYNIANVFFGEDVAPETLKKIVYDTLSFDTPLKKIDRNIYALELFHGPTLAFKDVGGTFLWPDFCNTKSIKNVKLAMLTCLLQHQEIPDQLSQMAF